MIGGNVEFKVTPEVLVEKADEVSAKLTKMQNLLDTIEGAVERTRSYWIGEAGDLHRKMYEDEKETIAEIMLRLNEHPVDLRAIAQTYMDVETAVTNLAEELPTDVLV